MSKLTITTINQNNALGLERTIKSVLSQTWKNYQYVIIDGASNDNSVNVIKKFGDQIDYWVSENDSGIYNAMNKGIKQATGEYCLFLNSGDYLYNNNVLEVIFSENFTEDLIYGNQFRIGDNGNRIILFPSKLTFYHFYTDFLAHNSTLIKKSLFDEIGLYNENYKIVSDHEFFVLAVCKYNCTTRYINEIISVMIDGGISNNPQYEAFVKKERADIFMKHFPSFIQDYDELYDLKYNSFRKKLKRIIKKLINQNL